MGSEMCIRDSTMGVVNKTFDIFEKEIVEDIVKTRIPADWTRDDVYER